MCKFCKTLCTVYGNCSWQDTFSILCLTNINWETETLECKHGEADYWAEWISWITKPNHAIFICTQHLNSQRIQTSIIAGCHWKKQDKTFVNLFRLTLVLIQQAMRRNFSLGILITNKRKGIMNWWFTSCLCGLYFCKLT